MSSHIDKVIATAASQIGVTEQPAYSNRTKFGEQYGWNGVAWCVIYVWWCFYRAGLSKAFYGGKKTASTETLYQWAKANGKWHTTGRRGDICLMNFGTPGRNVTHAGIVERMLETGPQTIEGNTSYGDNTNGGAVMRRARAHGYVVGYVRPDYPKADPTPAPTTAHVKTNGGRLMLRARPSVEAAILAKMPNGATVTVHAVSGSWSQVTYEGQTGWASSTYLAAPETTPTAHVKTNGGRLMLRAKPSLLSKVIARMPNGAKVTVINRGAKWSKVKYDGKTGYASNRYLDF